MAEKLLTGRRRVIAALLAVALGAWALRGGRVAEDPTAAQPERHAHQAWGELAEGEVIHVDKSALRITIDHGPIHNLGLAPMTLAFVVGDAAMLEELRPGDRVRFSADAIDGRFTVTKIERATAR